MQVLEREHPVFAVAGGAAGDAAQAGALLGRDGEGGEEEENRTRAEGFNIHVQRSMKYEKIRIQHT